MKSRGGGFFLAGRSYFGVDHRLFFPQGLLRAALAGLHHSWWHDLLMRYPVCLCHLFSILYLRLKCVSKQAERVS